MNDCISYKNGLGPLKLGEVSYIWVGSIHEFLENIPSRSENPNKNKKIPRQGGGILMIQMHVFTAKSIFQLSTLPGNNETWVTARIFSHKLRLKNVRWFLRLYVMFYIFMSGVSGTSPR